AFSALVLIINLRMLPSLPVSQSTSPFPICSAGGQRPIQLGLARDASFIAGHFMAHAFVHPLLQIVSGI
ncbi:MAG: MFS transporter, partial [Rhizobiales bacterium]|nr:MFS transporter [Hyphomicrobiales bacterium]